MNSWYQPLSNTERASVVSSLKSGVRLDGRALLENREYSIQFGKEYGSCYVSFGETRVHAQVTCEVVKPKPSHPNEGIVMTSVHIPPMAGTEFAAGGFNNIQDELQQLLKSSTDRCLDLEALNIKAKDRVWQFRVDVTVLNACGNLGDPCNMAAVGALKHFHRPDVTVEEDGRVTIHSFAERAPIPTFMKEVCVWFNYSFCDLKSEDENEDLVVISDPTNLEERVVSRRLMFGLDKHGNFFSSFFYCYCPVMFQRHAHTCVEDASQRAINFAACLESALEEDLNKPKLEVHCKGFVNQLHSDESMRMEQCKKRFCDENYDPSTQAGPTVDGQHKRFRK